MIDTIRGVSIVLMIFYHFGFDLVYFGFLQQDVMFHPVLNILEFIFSSFFIIISGISCNFSKNNIKRGFIVFGCAIATSIVTFIMGEDVFIPFGILHLLGVSMIIYGILRRYFDRVPPVAGLTVSVLLFVLFYFLTQKTVTVGYLWMFGFMTESFVMVDHFPLLPWIFTFIFGTYAGIYIKKGKFPKWFYSTSENIFSKIGGNTLVIYMLHQPVLFGFLTIINFSL